MVEKAFDIDDGRVEEVYRKSDLARAALKSGDGDGTSSGMEARVAVLEAHMETVRRDVGELRTDMRDVRDRLTKIEGDVKHLPGKGYVVTVALAIMVFVAAVVTFQQQIQHFVHG